MSIRISNFIKICANGCFWQSCTPSHYNSGGSKYAENARSKPLAPLFLAAIFEVIIVRYYSQCHTIQLWLIMQLDTRRLLIGADRVIPFLYLHCCTLNACVEPKHIIMHAYDRQDLVGNRIMKANWDLNLSITIVYQCVYHDELVFIQMLGQHLRSPLHKHLFYHWINR